ncbi:MAG: ATP-binding protein [Bacteroidales bacterium]|nr:ATP-binding protein [Bacteroidales bacterium]
MQRLLYNSLKEWKKKKNRKPLILNGARQVGKTYLLTEFGKREYAKVAAFSLDRQEQVRAIFEQDGNVERILRGLSAVSGIDITPNDTLVILDEIQDCPAALTALKYFCEDVPTIHVAVAGSLLGLSIHGNTSFPVGKVDMLKLYPMSYEEFMMALGKTKMLDLLKSGDWDAIKPLANDYIDILRQYYYVGGMPSAVMAYIQGLGLNEVRNIQNQILYDYSKDFSKHAPAKEVPRIQMVWRSIPAQLSKENKKFIFGALRKGARANDFEMAIQWLIDAGLVYKVNRVDMVKMPLKFYEDFDVFKLFMLDVGLMGAMVEAPASAVLLDNNIFTEYKGAFAELYVCTQLLESGLPVYYHSSNTSTIELDFVVQASEKIYPIEVKAGINVHSKSLRTFISNNPDLKGVRFSMLPYIDQDWLSCYPLWGLIGGMLSDMSERCS